jgi:hypothetical protein
MVEWFARYEEWVVARVGVAWRCACFAERRKAPPAGAEQLSAAWWRISARIRALELIVDDFTAPALGA